MSMKIHIYTIGVVALALTMSGFPASVLAERDGLDVSVDTQLRTQTQGTDISASASTRSGETEDRQKQNVEEQDDQIENILDELGDEMEIELELEDDEDVALSLADLKLKIEARKNELEDEEGSTTPRFKNAVKNANEVRLAVHALLAAKPLLGGIGGQVSEIAKAMNDSVASTTNAEVEIQSRGFFARIFFGGDKKAAEIIGKETEHNQESIEKLNELMGQANLSTDLKTEIEAQIIALEEAQVRLQALAEKERSAWGIFSWRF